MDWIDLAQNTDKWRALLNGSEPTEFRKMWGTS
jgi:hypothetical protein